MSAMPYMYILECADGSLYVGSTWDVERRLSEHGNGTGSEYTRRRLPVRLVHLEEYPRIVDAFAREKQVQGWGRTQADCSDRGAAFRLAGSEPYGGEETSGDRG
jgi:putative endonuclease